jgi:hypothetical protein
MVDMMVGLWVAVMADSKVAKKAVEKAEPMVVRKDVEMVCN